MLSSVSLAANIQLPNGSIPCLLNGLGTPEACLTLKSCAGVPPRFTLVTVDGQRLDAWVTLRRQGGEGAMLYVDLLAMEARTMRHVPV